MKFESNDLFNYYNIGKVLYKNIFILFKIFIIFYYLYEFLIQRFVELLKYRKSTT